MSRFHPAWRVWGRLLCANIKAYAHDQKRLWIMALSMIAQNTIFFCFWLFLFMHVDELKGWHFADVARMYGLTASAIGLSLFFCNGIRTIAFKVQDGSMDQYIAQPRATLPLVMFSASSPASLGDIFYGPMMWLWLGQVSLPDFLSLSLLTLNAAILFTAMTLAIYALAFWLRNVSHFCENIFEALVISTSNILHGQPLVVRGVLFTLLPTGFISILPIQIVASFNPALLLCVLGASLFYGGIAIMIFNRGVERYRRA